MPEKVTPFEEGKGKEKEKVEEGATAEKEKKTPLEGGCLSDLPFEKVEIHVEREAQKAIPTIPVGAFGGAGEGDEVKGNEVAGEIPDDIDLDSLKALINSGVNIPALYAGTFWLRTQEQTDIFATELYVYCQKKGIDIREYIFDELPLILAAVNLGGGIYQDYQKHREEEEKKKEEGAEE